MNEQDYKTELTAFIADIDAGIYIDTIVAINMLIDWIEVNKPTGCTDSIVLNDATISELKRRGFCAG